MGGWKSEEKAVNGADRSEDGGLGFVDGSKLCFFGSLEASTASVKFVEIGLGEFFEGNIIIGTFFGVLFCKAKGKKEPSKEGSFH